MDTLVERPATSRAGAVQRRARLVALACALLLAVDSAYGLAIPYLFFDVPLERAVQSVNWGPLLWLFAFYDWLGGIYQFFAALALIALVFVLNRKATWLMAAGALTGAWYSVMNVLIHRPRPSSDLVHVTGHLPGYGYPSGHAAFYCSFSILLVLCLGLRYLSGRALWVAWLAAAAITVTSAINRVYVGQHWPSDVLAGLAIGVGWTAFVLSIPRLSNPVLDDDG